MFEELVRAGVIRCPESGDRLELLEPWLLAAEGEAECLYPMLGNTPILQPDIDGFLETEIWTLCRALAEWPGDPEARRWYFSRFGNLGASSAPEIDTDVRGEGYPGFWEQVNLPEFVRPLVTDPPEQILCNWLEGEHIELALDLGCGQGGMVQYMAEMCERVIGLDRNFYLAALANQQLPAEEISVRYLVPERGMRGEMLGKEAADNALVICGDVYSLPFAEGVFDWINCGHVLDLVEDPAEVLTALTPLLRPGGWLTICSPMDFEVEGHFEELPAILGANYTEFATEAGVPWLRFNHKRRQVLHEDWLWAGKRRI